MSYLGSSKIIKKLCGIEGADGKKALQKTIISVIYTEKQIIEKNQCDKKYENISAPTTELVALLTPYVKKIGVKSYLEQMSQVDLSTLYEDFNDEESEKEKDKKKNKVFLVRKITSGITEDFDGYFTNLKGDKLKIFLQLTASQLSPKIIEEITLVGVEIFLFNVQTATLKYICEKLGYVVPNNNPNVMVTSILTGAVPAKKEAPAKKVITFSKKKLPLKKGLRYHDIFQHYYVEELQSFCREEGLKISGTKKEVINRILNFLNHGIAEIPKGKKVDDAEEEEETKEVAQEAVTDEEDEDDAELEEVEVPETVAEVAPAKSPKSTPKRQTSKIVAPSPSKPKKSTK
ncbi:hypothetical protein DICPUDRAFT_156466 [Dictyostelium purpureum]|uniref:SAP domain-containing protein n=1 Tax=Dictyostelium purpureum TaxID=5786 RepID=F0ZWM9_DICPU|nr:uncharacterized protein DICPUDRAFT_156466 [Dictyostelium purpureum]EGC31658.1 hypothetical protein DICPUDRAFT_156466 [Dictyostelium purpureum]|eukprot:XP_003291824.1 hypothetical protein DICPUDRAFT_156466 [Dictyostelium purpureum]